MIWSVDLGDLKVPTIGSETFKFIVFQEVVHFWRRQLIAIAPQGKNGKVFWSVLLSAASGNTDHQSA
jgi:hypothetical protein